jgi:F0F1-type ATP synthase assembly protein I
MDQASGLKTAQPNMALSLKIQSMAGIGMALVALFVGPVAAYSSLFGSLAVLLPGLGFTALVVRKMGGESTAFLGTAALAEFGKLILTGVLCAMAFVFVKPLAAGFFFLGMISVLVASWIGLAMAFRGS